MNWLPMAEFAYNNRVQVSTKYSPFMLNSGQNPRMGHEMKKTTGLDSVEKFVEAMKRTREDVESALKKAAEDMKKYYDRKRGKTPQYVLGEKVWLDASNIQTGRPAKKLDHRRLGPFPISKVLTNNTYQLKLPKTMKIHPVFSVIKLIPFSPNEIPERMVKEPPPPIIKAGVEEFEIEEILDSRMKRGRLQYLIHWKGYNAEDDSWEPAAIIFEDAPEAVQQFHDDHPTAVQQISTEQIILPVKKLSENAHLPRLGSAYAAGVDLNSTAFIEIPPHERALIPTGITIAIPEGHYARIALRSGLALKNSIDIAARVIDIDYRGPIGVILVNHGNESFSVSPGDRIAQLILERSSIPSIIKVQSLPPSIRDGAGFGSMGV